MAKRSNFKRVEKDLYRTFDRRAVLALLPHIQDIKSFAEPFSGHGDLVSQLQDGHGYFCAFKSDIDPMADISFGVNCTKLDFKDVSARHLNQCDAVISNPPWTRSVLHDAINHFRLLKQTWFLFDADWSHTAQSSELMQYCSDIVSVGRLKWIKGTSMDGKDNCAWYRFVKDKTKTTFHGRV